MAGDLPNVHFEGLLGGAALARLFRGAPGGGRPFAVPRDVRLRVLEAFAVRTPVIVHEGGGAIYETGVQSGGGLGYRTDVELLTAMRRIIHEPELRDALAARGYARRIGEWSEARHLERYLDLIEQAAAARPGPFALSARPGPRGPAGADRPPVRRPRMDRPHRDEGADDRDARAPSTRRAVAPGHHAAGPGRGLLRAA